MTQRIFTNKKGIGFMLLASIGILLAAFILIIFTRVDISFDPLGTEQYSILHANEQAEAAKTYIDLAANYGGELATDELFEKGGLYYEASDTGVTTLPCGEYVYASYSSEKFNCEPNFPIAYEEFYKEIVGEYFATYTPAQLTMYFDISLKQLPQNILQIQGKPQKNIKIPLMTTSQITALQTNTQLPQTGSNYLQLSQSLSYNGPLGGYMQEQIVPCGTGKCVADIAIYYRALYSPQINLPYVWGGLSPYTYDETIAARDSTAQSFFYNIGASIPSINTKTNQPINPGFDCSGFVWWVGKHAGIQEFDKRTTANQYREEAKTNGAQLICGEDMNLNCTLDVIIDKAEPGDILFYASVPQENISHIMIYIGNGEIVHSRGSTGLTKQSLESTSYVPSTGTSIRAAYRYMYKQNGYPSLAVFQAANPKPQTTTLLNTNLGNVGMVNLNNPVKPPTTLPSKTNPSKTTISKPDNYISFTPFMNSTTLLDLEALQYISNPGNTNTFLSFLHDCDNTIQSCVETQINKFNALAKPRASDAKRVQVTRNGEKDALAYSITEQLLDCYRNEQTNCICPITIDANLASRYPEFVMELSADGTIIVGEESLGGIDSSSEEFVLQLPFNPTKSYYDSSIPQTTSPTIPSPNTPSQNPISPPISIPLTGALSQVQREALITEKSNALGMDPTIALAIFSAESRSDSFCSPQTPIIRFEPHIFGNYYNQAPWYVTCSANPPLTKGEMNECMRNIWDVTYDHGSTCSTNHLDRTAFDYAESLNQDAAYMAISTGIAQIMGFNHGKLGYPSAKAQYDAFALSEKTQIEGFFLFIEKTDYLLPAVLNKNFVNIARYYNGEKTNCQTTNNNPAACYSVIIKTHYDALRGAVPVTPTQQQVTQQGSTATVFTTRDYVEIFVDKTNNNETRLELQEALLVPDETWDVPSDTLKLALLKTSLTNLSWIKYDSSHDSYVCRNNKHNYRFTSNFTFTDKELQFSVYLNDTKAPQELQPLLTNFACNNFDAVLFTWEVPLTETDIYSFDLSITNTSNAFPSSPNLVLLESAAKQAPQSQNHINVAGQLYVDTFSHSNIKKYYYLLSGYSEIRSSSSTNFNLLNPLTSYSYTLTARDHFNNSLSIQKKTFTLSNLPVSRPLSLTCVHPSLLPPFTSGLSP